MTGSDNLYNEMPRIRRARDYRLYGFGGERYLDLCLDGGRALLGHKPGRAVLMMKNSLEKGLAASYPGIWEKRLLRQIQLVYPDIAGVSVVFYGRAAVSAGKDCLPVYRPFEQKIAPSKIIPDEPFELLVPLPGCGPFSVVCAAEAALKTLPGPDPVPQYMLAGLCRAAAELKAFAANSAAAAEDPWSAFESSLWSRKGPWLYPVVNPADYPLLFRRFLEKGILISPDYRIPSCAPAVFTAGEIQPIKIIEGEFLKRD